MFCGIIEDKRVNSPRTNGNIPHCLVFLNMNDYDVLVFVFLIAIDESKFSKSMAICCVPEGILICSCKDILSHMPLQLNL